MLEEIEKLEQNGIRNAAGLYAAVSNTKSRSEFVETSGLNIVFLNTLFRLTDLTRVQWVSPTAARMLMEAGYDNVLKLAAADDEDLHHALIKINEGDRFFKGKTGLRDIRRLNHSARYLQNWLES